MPTDYAPSRRNARWFTVFTLVGVVLLAGLGTWQLQRLDWKENLIAQREAGMEAPPLAPGDVDVPTDTYRRVTLTGTFNHDHEFFLAGRTQRGQSGFHVVTPLAVDDVGTVFVDRGWIPNEARDPAARPGSRPEGEVSFTGLVRQPAQPSWFTAESDPVENYWFWVDLPRMARTAGIEAETGWYAMAGQDAPWKAPIPHDFEIDLRNDHLQYALTWYLLAVGLAVLGWLYRRRAGGTR